MKSLNPFAKLCLIGTVVIACMSAPFNNSVVAQTQLAKLEATDNNAGDLFSRYLERDGDRMIIGAQHDDDTGGFHTNYGAVYIFEETTPGNWTEVAKLQANDKQQNDILGHGVGISGDWALAGAPGANNPSHDEGAAYFFKRDGSGNWSQVQKISASDPAVDDGFGIDVAISGSWAFVGARWEDTGGNNRGAVYVFKLDGTGMWNQTAKLQASDAMDKDEFGEDLNLHGDHAIIGARFGGGGPSGTGKAYIFERDANDNWNEVAILTASDAQSGDRFGAPVDIKGDRAIVGAEGEDSGGDHAGAAYIFERDGNGNWNQAAKLVACDAEELDFFRIVSIDGDLAVAGAPGEDTNEANAGAVYVYHRDGNGNWVDAAKFQPNDIAAGDVFGIALALEGDEVLVGSLGNSNAGAAYVFDLSTLTPPCVPDADGDGIDDVEDNCPLTPNANQEDADMDGLGDACDTCFGENSSGDADGDGYCADEDCNDNDAAINPDASELCDGIDNDCDENTDEGFADTDGDAQADCIDPDDDNDGCLDAEDSNPLVASGDNDGDGIPNDCDNCVEVANSDQLNSDGDANGGDACDACPADPDHTDYNGDGFPDCANCGNNNNKVLICHVPPGNPCNEHEICISVNAADAHLDGGPGHEGCYVGVCLEIYCPQLISLPTDLPAATGRLHTNAGALSDSVTTIRSVKRNMVVYPNPTQGLLTISGLPGHSSNCKISLVDQAGQIVWSRAMPSRESIRLHLRDQSLTNGVYLLKVELGHMTWTEKLAIMY